MIKTLLSKTIFSILIFSSSMALYHPMTSSKSFWPSLKVKKDALPFTVKLGLVELERYLACTLWNTTNFQQQPSSAGSESQDPVPSLALSNSTWEIWKNSILILKPLKTKEITWGRWIWVQPTNSKQDREIKVKAIDLIKRSISHQFVTKTRVHKECDQILPT